MKKTVVEAVILVAVASAVGLGYNAARDKDSIDLKRNYFPKTAIVQQAVAGAAADPDTPDVKPAADDVGFQTVDIYTAYDYFQAMDSSIVFVDARKDAAFEKGHIPGAVQFDHYNPDAYLDAVLDMTREASVVIIYCNGGECVDSKNAANFLVGEIETPLQFERVYVFTGGIEEWCIAGYEIEGECQE